MGHFSRSYLKNSKSRSKARRKPTKKRSIHCSVVCEYFEKAYNAAFER